MTTGLHIKHAFVSAKADGTDNTLVKPSNWNEDHAINMDSGKILGNQSGSNGPVQQLDCSADAATMLSQANIAAILAFLGVSAPTTGDARLTLKNAPTTGWIMMDDGTIGNATSGASTRANADTQDLFLLLYASPFVDASVPILTSGGVATTRAAQGSAATAYANGCRLTLPKSLGRALLVAGSGSGLTARVLGTYGGEENHALTTAELASHYHAAAIYDPSHVHGFTAILNAGSSIGLGGSPYVAATNASSATSAAVTGVRVNSANGLDTTYSAGSGTAHNNMSPWAAWNVMVKL